MFLVTLKVNNDCDADRDSYDAMVLLTGRYDYEEMGGGNPESTSFCLLFLDALASLRAMIEIN